MKTDESQRRVLRIKSRYAAFSRNTTFHGFSELFASNRWYQKCLWILIMFGCTGILCYQIVEQLDQYFSCELVTTSTRFPDDQKYDFPQPLLNFRGSSTWIDVSKVQSLGFTLEEIQVAIGYLRPRYKNATIGYDSNVPVEQAKRSRESEREKRRVKAKMDQLGFNGIYDLFTNIVWKKLSGVEKEHLSTAITFSKDYAVFTLSTANVTKHEWARTWEKVLTFSFTAFWENKNRSTEFFKHGNGTSYSGSPALFNPDTNQQFFLEPNRMYTISADCRLYRRLEPCTKNPTHGYYPALCKLECELRINPRSCFPADETGNIVIELGESFRNGSIPLCNLGITVNGTIKGADIPVVRNLTNSEKRQAQGNVRACQGQCLPKCETYSTSWSVFSTPYTFEQADQPTDSVLIKMNYPDAQTMAITDEVERYKWHDIVSNIGGLLGLWLGASIMSIFQAVHLCCCQEEEEAKEVKKELVANPKG